MEYEIIGDPEALFSNFGEAIAAEGQCVITYRIPRGDGKTATLSFTPHMISKVNQSAFCVGRSAVSGNTIRIHQEQKVLILTSSD